MKYLHTLAFIILAVFFIQSAIFAMCEPMEGAKYQAYLDTY